MTKFNATVEFINGQHAAVITLETLSGEWSGGGRISLSGGTRSDLYELGYIRASQCAAAKGGTIETYRLLS